MHLDAGKLTDVENWRMVLPSAQLVANSLAWRLDSAGKRRPYARVIATERAILCIAISDWLRWGDVRPILTSDREGEQSMDFNVGGLFGALARQVQLAVGKRDALAICSECRQTYTPTRRPNPHRRNYCEVCRADGVPQRDAARDWRKAATSRASRDQV
jgi:hypothetical protein